MRNQHIIDVESHDSNELIDVRPSTHLFRTINIFENKQGPSRDIAQGFGVLEHLRFICAGGSFTFDGKER